MGDRELRRLRRFGLGALADVRFLVPAPEGGRAVSVGERGDHRRPRLPARRGLRRREPAGEGGPSPRVPRRLVAYDRRSPAAGREGRGRAAAARILGGAAAAAGEWRRPGRRGPARMSAGDGPRPGGSPAGTRPRSRMSGCGCRPASLCDGTAPRPWGTPGAVRPRVVAAARGWPQQAGGSPVLWCRRPREDGDEYRQRGDHRRPRVPARVRSTRRPRVSALTATAARLQAASAATVTPGLPGPEGCVEAELVPAGDARARRGA